MREPNGRRAAALYMKHNRKTSTAMPDDPRCSICKCHHPAATHGVTHEVCKAVPEGFVYVNQEFPSGPPGVLLALKADAR